LTPVVFFPNLILISFFFNKDVDYLRTVLPQYVENEFYEYLLNLKLDDVDIYALPEGSLAFPRVPLIIVEGPLIKAQLLETTLLVLVNYASLITTNAARFRFAAGDKKNLLEFGLRRAQGPDGGVTASKYSYIGGFDGTSNVLAGKLFGIPVRGTNAHAFITSYHSLDELPVQELKVKGEERTVNLVELSQKYLNEIKPVKSNCNIGELASFIAYALAFPDHFLVLVDTYNVIKSGIVNFCAVALALNDAGYQAIGVRLDSGDLSYLSIITRNLFKEIGSKYKLNWFENLNIVASNDINENVLHSLNIEGNEIDTFGIGTHLVTCQKQPALGCVYKLVQVNGEPCVKLSQDLEKATFPSRKRAYRLFDKNECPVFDVMLKYDEEPPRAGVEFKCRHPVNPHKAAFIPYKVKSLHQLVWSHGEVKVENRKTLPQVRDYVTNQMKSLRSDHKRLLNPTPYKVSVSEELYKLIHELWEKNQPVEPFE